MHGRGNYNIQVGQDPYARPPAFQQHSATTAPPTSHYGPIPPQLQVTQHGHPSFHPRPGAVPYQHVMTNVQHHGRSAPVMSGGMSTGQSYAHHPRPPQISNQISHPYSTIEQRPLPWSQNVHQLPPPPPLQGQSAFQLTSSQGNTLERGHPSHAPPPPLPHYSSSSNVMTSDPCGSSVNHMREHSYQQSMTPVLPLPPPPPPTVPPLPPSSPSSNFLSMREGSQSQKGLPDEENLELDCPPHGKSMNYPKVQFQHTESEFKVGSVDAEASDTHTDSDMDMEDDITYPDEEKKNCPYVNSNDECGPMSQEDYTAEELQPLQHTRGHGLSEISVHGNLLFAEASVAHAKEGGSDVASDCNLPVTMKVFSRAELGKPGNGQKEISLDASVNKSPSENKYFGESGGPVNHPEPDYGELPGQSMNEANPTKIVQGYSSNSTSENKEENLGDVSLPSTSDATKNYYSEKGHDVGLADSCKSLSKSNKHVLPESVNRSPINVMQADKLDITTGGVAKFSDRSHKGQKPVSSGTYTARQSKDSSRNYDESVGVEEANSHKPDMKAEKPKVDKFGRLIREDVSDSDLSDSPRHVRRHARRTRRRSRSQSRSRSPHDRRRRRMRSPWRRKERCDRSRSLSPRRRSRSRSPVLRRDTEFSADKLRWEKVQPAVCFDFLQGKCYRGAACRYSHHESGKGERSRYSRGKHHNWDAPPTLRSPNFQEEGKVLTKKEVNDKGRKLSQDVPALWEAKDAKRLPVVSTSQSPDKIDILSSYPADDIPAGKHNYLIPETASKHSDKIPQILDQQVTRTNDNLPSESSLAQVLFGAQTHHPADGQDPSNQLRSVESHLPIPYSNQGVPSWSFSPPITNHPSQLSIPLPSASQPVSASFDPPILQKYNSNPPTSQNHLTPKNYSSYEAPVTYQHSHFPGPLKSVSSMPLPPPPLPLPLTLPPPPASLEHSTPSQHMQQSLLPPCNGLYSHTSLRNHQTEMPNRSQIGEYQAYSFAREPDQMLHRTDGSGSSSLQVSSLTSREGGPRMMDEVHLSGELAQGISSSKSFTQAQTSPLSRQSAFKGIQSSIGAGFSADSNFSHSHSHFQQASYGMQYSASGDVPSTLPEPGMMSSSASRITQDFLERNRSYVHCFVGSKISNHFYPYASTFDLPLSSKLSSNTLLRGSDATANTTYVTPVGLSSAPVDPHRNQCVGSTNMMSSSSVLPPESVSRPVGDQYDPLFDSIEQNSNSTSKADRLKHEITGDSNDLKVHESRGSLNMEVIRQERETAVSADDSLEKEECGETADVAVGPALNSDPSTPNDALDMNVGEFEIDQVKSSGKNKKRKEKSTKLFKISIAAFVKDVLKPSWRQGNMSKEAFKTIVKKTVDKVSGAMKSHQIPKSQAKINHYIDSSRGKLTKLVMGYVDKYVKV
ncbi:uncharacterized protein LOC121748307 [Salvia splendens]|uniref:uncharacterized protein LOC121748307 n=1 Tax=Salvia splendens TaxID=180675 RepID=UPI001C2696A3|nr:uncharacterized protein LOC121748307 [Salvia splendens]XP_041998505.1 uncharacterized protein LOC121748307 [Salvia splendens]XP_041998506.1 uncharacterized protein LOC121748307 [Salvia splendens]XP_041998507.1 uncharacterized protein LOC121748307 [Salvia splendens]XP_041998508.1 uncharacterized protein LOC121748307 [Salvia splendens]XP_041998509.1 uncharacterized protein LOC121748307 [Salvia splendens]XP_041998510.1 uncharacterized protein LOC121748307 [Salvia splendens]XP_041998511.1 unc